MFNKIPPSSLEILKALSYFHFLNNEHIVELGIANSEHSLNAWALTFLVPSRDKQGNIKREKGKQRAKFLCNNLRYGNTDIAVRGGKLPYLHYMTEKGLDYLYWACEDELMDSDDLWIPKPLETLTNDYFHRTHYISAHIYIRRWAQSVGANIDFFNHDYQGDPLRKPERGRPVSINMIVWNEAQNKRAKPDGIFGLDHNGKKRLFLLELHRHTQTNLVIEQLYRNFKAIPSIKAKFPDYPTLNDPFVLSVHTKPEILKATKQRVLANPNFKPILKGLLFADLADLRTGFANAWTYADGTPAKVFI